MKVTELKEELQRRDLSIAGLKKDVRQRGSIKDSTRLMPHSLSHDWKRRTRRGVRRRGRRTSQQRAKAKRRRPRSMIRQVRSTSVSQLEAQ